MIVHQCGADSNFEEESGVRPSQPIDGGRGSTKGRKPTLARNRVRIPTPK